MQVEAPHLSPGAVLQESSRVHFGSELRIRNLRPDDLTHILLAVPTPAGNVTLNFKKDDGSRVTEELDGSQFEDFVAPGGRLDALTAEGFRVAPLSSVELHRTSPERRLIVGDVVLHFSDRQVILDVGSQAPREVADPYTQWFQGLVGPQQA